MAPHAQDIVVSGSESTNTNKSQAYVPSLYHDVDEQDLQQSAREYLANYGIPLHTDIITGAKDLYVYNSTGHRILDWTSGQMSCLIGHGHPEIVSVIHDYASNLDHLFSAMVSPPVINLAKRLASVLPKPLSKTVFLSTGGESNEAAIKMAKIYTGKFEIVGLGASWHGMTAQALSSQYFYGRRGQGPLVPGSHQLPAPNAYRSIFRHPDGSYDWETELNYGWEMVDRASCGSLAACIVEIIQSTGGMHVLPPGYLTALKKHCEKRGMLLIIDEAQTGVGRTGDLFAFNHENVVPDILTLSKTLGNGIPLSAVVTSPEIDRVCTERGFMFITTHVNDPMPAAVGDKVLEIVQRDNLVENSRLMGLHLEAGLKKLQSRYGCVGDVRGRGLMMGMEIVADRDSKAPSPELAQKLADKIYELGLWANLSSHPVSGGSFRIAPPITTTRAQIDEGIEILERALAATKGSQPLY
ncbi:2,2-dialkylglycine decarboxylase (pyruvate) [Capronia epimyces CBS 606.96]|uniref:2,2-dialkylglycine decarboxylase (Pyruvate) n=1 Tax=Capronia epimyces CBS 606.96 TaxID=1182542 RepID=W9Y1E0_9EURO|nr:2,2-dialkylglycine decarboxylase (pyruvate) [Capronia epimyces CBS 606.96]EXJ86303.1 2,2-dialkylglycine decarboxylase (pyruvate) [Capronia epimyces CBS 606.96]